MDLDPSLARPPEMVDEDLGLLHASTAEVEDGGVVRNVCCKVRGLGLQDPLLASGEVILVLLLTKHVVYFMAEGIEEDEIWNMTELLWKRSSNGTAIRLVDLSRLRTGGCRRMNEVFQDRLVVESGVLRRRT